ncbi:MULTISPECIES: Stp1/IreP family PP2C-type Ser/Thr phosphatase [unclassified Streptomyces]|uniref:Stp1/IreP family PP2C-type Ser/Thr phosphatase n=1 Tax=unclassified Streptomyces TaxID=2593676 RepID=UPI0019069744|nr:Stp1/IreP family PP2C-type Ser/Thr phosphatase [Streptomyces sp. HSG2]
MSLSLRFAAGSHRGMIREGNEDSGYAGPRLLAIADGMGGQAAGEVASSEVISTIVALDDDIPGSDVLTSLGTSVQRANDQLRQMVAEDPSLEGMGTTLTALLWTGQRLGLVHVGDSRAYLLRDGTLSQITQDHTWVQRLVDEGRITEEEAGTHPQRSLLMRALGSGDHVEPDLSIREVRPGDRYLICSDGLSGVVSRETMQETLAGHRGPEDAVQELIQLALRGGGPDNITVIIADVLDPDAGGAPTEPLYDTPVVVGAVAENQHQLTDNGIMQTPAGRASGLGRPGGGHGGADGAFGDPGGGPEGADAVDPSEDFGGEAFVRPRRRRRWLKVSLYSVLALSVVGAGLYGGWRWTQSQYYVGANDDHVALYRGISQDLAWVSLSKVEKDHPEIELRYLPPYQQKLVESTIAEGDLNDARSKIDELAVQASACQKQLERAELSESEAATAGDEAADAAGTTPASLTSKASPTPSPSSPSTVTPSDDPSVPEPTSSATPPNPDPGPTLSEEEQKVVSLCGQQ